MDRCCMAIIFPNIKPILGKAHYPLTTPLYLCAASESTSALSTYTPRAFRTTPSQRWKGSGALRSHAPPSMSCFPYRKWSCTNECIFTFLLAQWNSWERSWWGWWMLYFLFKVQGNGQVRKMRRVSLLRGRYSRKIFRSFILFGHFISAFFCEVEYSVLLEKSVLCEDCFTWGMGGHCGIWVHCHLVIPRSIWVLCSDFYYLCCNLSDTPLIKKVCFNRQKFYFSEWTTMKTIFPVCVSIAKEKPGVKLTSIFYFSLSSVPRGLSWAPWRQ